MTLEAASKEVHKLCLELEDLEITFRSDTISVTWENLAIDCPVKNLGEAIAAIKVLQKLNAYFQ